VAFVLNRPGVYLNSVGDIHQLPKVLSAAARFSAGEIAVPLQAEMHALVTQREMSNLFV
jgi:hypothetical protein